MWWLGLLIYSSKVVHIAIVLLQMQCDLFHIFMGPLEVFASPLLKAIDAQFAAVFHNPDVLIPNWIILAFDRVVWDQNFALRVFLVLFDDVLLIFLNHEPQVLNLTLRLLRGKSNSVRTCLRGARRTGFYCLLITWLLRSHFNLLFDG